MTRAGDLFILHAPEAMTLEIVPAEPPVRRGAP